MCKPLDLRRQGLPKMITRFLFLLECPRRYIRKEY